MPPSAPAETLLPRRPRYGAERAHRPGAPFLTLVGTWTTIGGATGTVTYRWLEGAPAAGGLCQR
ncbi:hypothetical protein [Acrocarpospora pleiomorpha]|uniref:hypothetical protein n=1 Tax=Acrocarpospora pleiomorpha TaxID=90975 RepID=UPI0012D2C05A|nr:hypothetical protein [Acrocarpospora pleiomorpha]